MKLSTVLSTLPLVGAAWAQDVQSDPFYLSLQSTNGTLDGQKLAACHTGAAIESLCLTGGDGSTFFFNTTTGTDTPVKGYEPSGVLVWNLPVGKNTPFFKTSNYLSTPSK
jgi:hypothetical protein